MTKNLTPIILLFIGTLLSSEKMVADTSIKVLTEDINPGHNFNIKISTDKTFGEKAWVGIFKPGSNGKSASGYESYEYLRNHDINNIVLRAPIAPGLYELRLFAADPGEFMTSTSFQVVKIQPNQYTLKILSEEIKPSHDFMASVSTTFTRDKKAWLGIYKSGSNLKDYSGYLTYVYVGGKNEKKATLTAPIEPGDYQLRFYSADPGALIHYIPFHVGNLDLPGLAFKTDKDAYGPEEEIIVEYTGHQDLTNNAWIGVFNTDAKSKDYSHYLDYRYLRPNKTGGTLQFRAPSTKGNYELRLYYDETGPQLLSPTVFKVTSSLDDASLKKTLLDEGKVTLYGIYFDTDKSVIKPESHPLIAEIAKMLNSDTSIKIMIEGHTDAQGDDMYNMKLSDRRAKAVFQVLITKHQVSKNQLQFKGFGETRFIGDNKTEQGRAKNRRVELKKL
ncbi:OmpA family protein [Flagellimonas pacifica]|uniref:Outer membrane protein OmpA n=1 Tax=Flagellimonas pacifica TaxID=1247520 RepID=A0A285MYR0_9FLAO|nr:OmpA family protein [Allomuricauda parva]SNZ00926.1 Outer membrane protein OmpA [Allomuricauda parva]